MRMYGLAVFLVLGIVACSALKEPQVVQGFIVTSIVHVSPGQSDEATGVSGNRGGLIYLPNVQVTLANASDFIGPLPTDLAGRFSFHSIKPGSYTLCWQADGFKSDCLDRSIVVHKKMRHLGLIPIHASNKKQVAIYGNVEILDSTSTKYLTLYTNSNVLPVISLIDSNSRVIGQVYANSYGDYILPGVPPKKDMLVRIVIDKSHYDIKVVGSQLHAGNVYRLNVYTPGIHSGIVPRVVHASAGQSTRVSASDIFAVQSNPSKAQTVGTDECDVICYVTHYIQSPGGQWGLGVDEFKLAADAVSEPDIDTIMTSVDLL